MKDLNEKWPVQARVRGYMQTDAEFYRHSYDAPASFEFYTFDKKLASLWSAGGGAALFCRVNHAWTVSLRGEAYQFRYRNFLELPRRTAIITTLNASKRW